MNKYNKMHDTIFEFNYKIVSKCKVNYRLRRIGYPPSPAGLMEHSRDLKFDMLGLWVNSFRVIESISDVLPLAQDLEVS